MITMIANADQNSPHATRNSPPHGAILVLPHGSAAVAGRNAIIAPSTTPIAATVKPWSSFTNTSGTAHAIAATGRRRATAETENASSGTASAILWKSKLIICCRPQENAYANPISRPVLRPVNTNAAVTTGKTDTAASSAWKNSSVPAEGDLEVVAEQVEPGAEHVDDGGVQLGQLLDVLGVDAEVVRARRQLQQPE